MPDAQTPAELKAAIAKGKGLIVCGAGVSQAATERKAPGWERLIRDALAAAAKPGGGMTQPWAKACQAFLKSKEVPDWLCAADTIQRKLGGPAGGAYHAFFAAYFGSLTATRLDILQSIGKIAAAGNRIATTNYDHLVSKALNWDRADWTNHLRVFEALHRKRQAVWHIHGDFDRPDSIIFSQNDYDRISASELPQFVQKSAGLDFTLVFVGCSGSGLSDDNVGRLLDWMRKGFAGLGDKHFVLVADDNNDTWPSGVTPVPFGDYPHLPAFLADLAPEPVLGLPPDPIMIDRKARLDELVEAILEERRPIVVLGAPGMGKTTLALAAAYHPLIIQKFQRFFVNLELSAEGVLARLATELGLPASGTDLEIETKITAACAARRTLVILDNLETPWRKDEAATEAHLGRLAAIAGLKLVITVRGEPPRLPAPGARTLQDIEQLGEADTRDLFLRHAGNQFATDPALPGLLKALDGHPLSIELLAGNAKGKKNLSDLARDWNDRRATMLETGKGGDRLKSLRVSLDISLQALGADSAPHRLIRLMALLPDGMSEADSQTTLSDDDPSDEESEAAFVLETARLAGRETGRWRLLAPIREALLVGFLPDPADRARLVGAFLGCPALGVKPGTSGWREVSESLIKETGNFDAIIRLAARLTPLPGGLSKAIRWITDFHCLTGLASVESLRAALDQFHDAGDIKGEANCLECLGDIALHRSDPTEARKHYEKTRLLYRKLENVLGEANCARGFGAIALGQSDYTEAQQHYEAAFALFKKEGDPLGEATCIEAFGDIALYTFQYETAHKRYTAALPLYKKVEYIAGEANCIGTLGDIEFERRNFQESRRRYEAALNLYDQAGDVLGQASCLEGLGDIAVELFEYEEAYLRYETALPLFQRIGSVLGEANCIQGHGRIALARADHKDARQRYEAALPLYQKSDNLLGQANCAQGLGDVDEAVGEIALAYKRWQDALALYRRIPDPYSIGLAYIRLARRAATPAEAAEHREAARKAWESIDRPDLIEQYLGKEA